MADDEKKGGKRVFGGARKGAKQWQEDSYMHYISKNQRVIVGGIFDGHGGYNGLIASQTAKEFAEQFCEQNANSLETWDEETWRSQLNELFSAAHKGIREKFLHDQPESELRRHTDEKNIVRNQSGDPIHGGSTGTIVVVVRQKDDSHRVISANVGDSAALLCPIDRNNPKSNVYQFLTVDHGPENPDEYQRVQTLNADDYPTKLIFVYDKANVFRKFECPHVFLDDGKKDPIFVENPWGNGLHPTNVRYEPAVYAVTPRNIQKDTTCIAMTRALGDFYAQQFGLSHVPSITSRVIPSKIEFSVTVASDGIWDCWKYEDWTAYINSKITAPAATVDGVVDVALNECIQRAITNFGAKHYDDASFVLIHVPKK